MKTRREKLTIADRFENVPKGGYIPAEHVKDLDKDGVYAGVVYPTASLLFYMGVRDSQLLSSIFRTYNDWVAEFCGEYPDRLKGIAMINLDNVQEGITEIERTRKMGLVGAMISVYPSDDRSYYMPEYEPLWAAAQDLDVPLSFHVATGRSATAGAAVNDGGLASTPAFRANLDFFVRMSLSHVIYSGAFERYPKLMVGTVEHELAWIPHFLDQIDYVYTQRPHRSGWLTFKNGALPTDFFHTNVFCSFQEDDRGIRDRDWIGVDTLMWGSDYPHPESTFPRSREILETILEGVPEEEKVKIVGG